MDKRSQLALRFQNFIFYILFALIIGMLAWLGKTYQKDFDFTHNQQNSLHESTRQLLQKLDKPLKLVAFVPDDAVVHSGLKKLLKKYKKIKPDTDLEFVNPELDPQRAKAEGIQYSGLMKLFLGKRSEIIKSVDEQTMLNALQRLSRDKQRLAIFLEGHGERSPVVDTSNGLSKLAGVLETKGFRFQPHNILRTQSIPDDTSILVIAGPQKDYLEGEVNAIVDYLKQGGNLLWLHDPGSLHGLDDVEQLLGLDVQEGTIVDANTALQKMLGIKHPAVIAVIDYGQSPLTRDLPAHTLFPFPTAILIDQESKPQEGQTAWQYQAILPTLGTSWLESGAIEGNVKFDDDADKPGPLNLGVLLSRGSPKDTSAGVKATEQRVFVLGDSDFLANGFIGQGSNLALASNLFNWLGQDDKLLSIDAINAPDTKLELPGWALYGSALFFLLGLPILLLLIGTIRWLRRKRR